MNVGERIKQRRKALKMSADELAESVGVSRSTIFRYEKGDIEKVGPEVLKKIADKLNVSPGDLMGWEDNQQELKIQPPRWFTKLLKRLSNYQLRENKKF